MFLRIASPYMAHVGLAILSDPQRYTLPYINRDTLLRLGTMKKKIFVQRNNFICNKRHYIHILFTK